MNISGARLAEHPFFCTMKREHLDLIASCATEAQFKPGDIIFKEKEPANRFYLIEFGKVALETHVPSGGGSLVQTLGGGDALGWSWLFPPFVWHFQARVLEPTQAIVLDGGHLLAASERDKEFGYELLRRVSQVVIRRLQATRAQLASRTAQAA
jgi:CRP/FNR family transcriptional regulator, cyclic AMP receptor protein